MEIAVNRVVDRLSDDVRRVTFRLPLGIDHVHCYFLRSADGGWILIDTGLAHPDPEARWSPVLAALDAPVERIVVTHFHPDHVGGAADVAALTGAPVLQGRADYEQCARVWGDPAWPRRIAGYMAEHGMPASEVERAEAESTWLAARIRFAREPERLDPGDRVERWEVLSLPGHADGHIALLRDGVLVAGDALLGEITPVVGLYPDARPDPLADYLGTLARIRALAPTVAFPGHGPPIAEPAARAGAIAAHHGDRLRATAAALGREPRTGYDVSLALFGDRLAPTERRFALAESLAHLERLVAEGEAARAQAGGRAAYTAPRATAR